MTEENLWSSIASISGKNKKVILLELNSPATPTLLAKRLKLHRSVVSRALIFMDTRGLVKCLNPADKVNRYYTRTALGNTICRKLNSV